MFLYDPPTYCPRCASKLIKGFLENRDRLRCPSCSYTYWGDCSVGVGGVVVQDGKVLLVQKAQGSGQDIWALPGGFAEVDEPVEKTVVREVYEETGLLSEPLSLLGVRDRPEDFPGMGHDIYFIFLMRQTGGTLQPDGVEISRAAFLTLAECRAARIAPLSLYLAEKTLSCPDSLPIPPGFRACQGIVLAGKQASLYSFL